VGDYRDVAGGDLDGDGAGAAGNQPFGISRAVITSRFAALPEQAQTALNADSSIKIIA
jgi:hypothetical protein